MSKPNESDRRFAQEFCTKFNSEALELLAEAVAHYREMIESQCRAEHRKSLDFLSRELHESQRAILAGEINRNFTEFDLACALRKPWPSGE